MPFSPHAEPNFDDIRQEREVQCLARIMRLKSQPLPPSTPKAYKKGIGEGRRYQDNALTKWTQFLGLIALERE
jgi:hypothetical protein